jgi:iron complex outermembrane receptor protein
MYQIQTASKPTHQQLKKRIAICTLVIHGYDKYYGYNALMVHIMVKHKYGYFPSLQCGWNISREGFLIDSDILETCVKSKLGTQTGSQEIPSKITHKQVVAESTRRYLSTNLAQQIKRVTLWTHLHSFSKTQISQWRFRSTNE